MELEPSGHKPSVSERPTFVMDLNSNQLSDRYNEAKQPAARSDEPPKPKSGKPLGEQRRIKLENGTIELPRDHKDRPMKFAGNSIRTSKYTVYNFLFLNLFTQLIRPANFYFVCIAILQGIPQVSSSQGKPTILLPLCFVLLVSAVKDGYEDYKRHVEDNGENNRQYAIYSPSENNFQRVASKELEVGHFVQVNDDETFPADLLLVYSSAKGGYCYVETSNLDGETNLKIKMVPEPLRNIKKAEELSRLSLKLNADAPNGVLDQFSGSVVLGNDPDNLTVLGVDNILLRGSKLRNTGIIYGLVMYTGEETKIRQNSTEKSRSTVKRSSVERTMNKQILGMFCLQVAICFIAAVIAGVWHGVHRDEAVYLALTDSAGLTGLIRFFTWFIIFAGFVPISLLVSLELVKFWQGLFMGWDVEMCHTVEADTPADRYQFARAQTSGLNEELGQVQFILSDKTGTLTCNSMDFRKCLIGTQQYGTGETDISRAARYRSSFMKTGSSTSMNATAPTNRNEKGWGRTLSEINLVHVEETYRKNHVNFNAKQRLEASLSANYLSQKAARESGRELPDTPGHGSLEEEFLLCLSLCNTVFPAVDDKPRKNQAPAALPSANADRIAYKSSSPDEEALVEFARFMGYELFQRNPPIISIRITRPAATHTTGSETVPFEQLALCDFTSKRKRMTVVVRAPDGKIRVITKGADNVVSAVLHGADAATASGSFDATLAQFQPNWPETVRQLARFGEQGLRTLVIASAERDASWWDDPVNGMSVKYSAAMRACAVEGPDEIGHFKGACSAQCRRCAIEEQVERAAELKLIGATAIEDKLQDNVADAIKAFTDGGIRVWVLTGDKMETAINIGMACNLLEPSMERKGNLLRIDSETQEGVEQQLDKLIETLSDRTSEQNKDALGLVVTSAAIGRVFRNGEALFPKFWWIASQCKGVICCRMQPNQKARVVALVKASTPAGVTTLAVGDGANDEQMIREADVGVGIRGVEGTSAVRASDYAISQFFFLKRLLFVHGRLSYRRIATLICYIFYKNSLICFTQFWFGIYSGFSGQPIFMEWAYQLYNVVFTAIPILVFAVLDRDISVELLEKYPKIYRLTSNGQLFNYRIFWRWMVSSLLQSLIIFFFVFAAYDLYSVDGDGQIHDFWTMGLVVYTVTVLVTNIQMALLMTSWTWIHHLAVWGSIFSFYLAMIIFSGSTFWATAGADYYWLQYRLFGTARYWFTVILAVCAALAIDFTIHAWFTLNPPPSKLSAGTPPIHAPKPVIAAKTPLVTSHVISDTGKSTSPATSPSLGSQGAGPEIVGKDQQPLWGRPSNVAQSPHHGAHAPSMPTVSEDGPGPDSFALIFDRGQIPPNTVDLEEKKEDPEVAARSAKEAAEWDPMRHQDTRLSGFSFSHTSGQGQRLGFKF